MKNQTKLAVALALTFALASCAHQPALASLGVGGPEFFMGIVHGVIAPFALVAGIFSDIRVYAFPNGGGWYDFGFLLGVSVWCGGAAATRK